MSISKRTLNIMMAALPLHVADAVRLCLEMVEEWGKLPDNVEREPLLKLLRRIIRTGTASVRSEEHTVSFAEAAWASIEARQHRRKATVDDLKYFVRRMLRSGRWNDIPLRRMTTQNCRDLLEASFGQSANCYRKGRAILHSIFSFGFRHEWCDNNPVDRIEVPVVNEKEIVPLTPTEIKRLLTTAAKAEFEDIRWPLYLMLYCGIRPTEVQRLDPRRDINWAERYVTVRPINSKTGGGRTIPLRCASMKSLPKLQHHMPCISAARWRLFHRRAGFRHWVPDVLRHTFASYHAAYFRNFSVLQMEMGHRDSSLLRTRYVNAIRVTRRDAAAFWGRNAGKEQTGKRG